MDIKKRLIIYNNLTIIIPFIITGIVAFIFIFVSSEFFNSSVTYKDFKRVSLVESELLNVSKDIAKSGSKDIKQDVEFQKYILGKLSTINGRIIIVKDGEIVFSSKGLGKIDTAKALEESDSRNRSSLQIENTHYSIDSFPLIFKDGHSGRAVFLVPAAFEPNIFKNFITALVVTFLVSFILMSVIISYIFSKKILEPISDLKKAMEKISRGDLDCEIAETGDMEIKELCADFEKMRIQLKDSVRMRMKYDENRKMLVSSISHDLKTPITSIEGYVQGILDGVANTPEKSEHYLNTIASKAKQIDSMINDLLLYSKLDLGQIPFSYEKTDIVEYLSCCVEESKFELKKSNIGISLENKLKNTFFLMIDRKRFMRVILNIIDNSRKYMDKESGIIKIILRETKTSVIIEIKDNGCGISKNDLNKVFSRFYRSDSSRSNARGSGLGLAIAKEIVQGHNGNIWAASSASEGTSIIISLAKYKGEYHEKDFDN